MRKFLAKLMTLPVEKQRAIIAEATRNLERQLGGATRSTPTVRWTSDLWEK